MSVSVNTDKQGRHRIQYRSLGKTSSLRLGGRTPKKIVEAFAKEFGVLLHHRECGLELPASTKHWLSGLSNERYAQLEARGFVPKRRGKIGFIEYLEDFFARRGENNKAPASTRSVWRRAIVKAKEFWKPDVPIDGLTGQDFADFRGFLLKQKGKRGGQTWAEASVNKCCGVISQALNGAVLAGILDRNPLRGHVKTTAGANSKNWDYIETDTIRTLITASSCPEERLLLGLSRFAGLRIPSEIRDLTWGDLSPSPDGECGVLKVHTPKTSNSGKHFKEVPVCRELLDLWKEAQGTTESGFVFPRLRKHSNPQMVVLRLCDRVGIDRWRRITHNLRASCLSDWLKHFGIIEVSQWAGNSPKVLLTHYCRSGQGTASLFAAARIMNGGSSLTPLSLTESGLPVATDRSPKAA